MEWLKPKIIRVGLLILILRGGLFYHNFLFFAVSNHHHSDIIRLRHQSGMLSYLL